MSDRRSPGGFTLIEMLVVILIMSMAAALAAPVLLRPTPGRSGIQELVATSREMAVRRGEALFLRMGTSGVWRLEAARATTGEPLATGQVDPVPSPLTLMLTPNGSCMFDVATVARQPAVQLDPLTCDVKPPATSSDPRAEPSPRIPGS
jgi:prepilin-type N-terminal cleavage/methylation domain-containing protein